jgi:hypothetical protein
MGRLYGGAGRPEGVFRAGEAFVVGRCAAQPPHRGQPGLHVHLDAARREGQQRDFGAGHRLCVKPNSEASVAVGGANFAMYTQNDGAWVKNAAEEAKLLDAMRKSADVAIKATTSRGTQTTDTFSLKGIAQAVDRAAQECK